MNARQRIAADARNGIARSFYQTQLHEHGRNIQDTQPIGLVNWLWICVSFLGVVALFTLAINSGG